MDPAVQAALLVALEARCDGQFVLLADSASNSLGTEHPLQASFRPSRAPSVLLTWSAVYKGGFYTDQGLACEASMQQLATGLLLRHAGMILDLVDLRRAAYSLDSPVFPSNPPSGTFPG